MLALPQDILVLNSVNLDNIQAPIEGKIEYLQVNALSERIIGIRGGVAARSGTDFT